MKRVFAAGLVVLAAAGAAHAQIGGQLFSTGGMVHIEVLPSDASYTSQLYLYSPGGPTFIGTNHDTGLMVDLGPFLPGEELIFGIHVINTNDTFLMGPGSRNADGIAHDLVTPTGFLQWDVGFEDQFGGGDLDYNDHNFRFTGEIIPGPAGVSLLGLAGAVACRRRRA